jgi:hypothetical protein
LSKVNKIAITTIAVLKGVNLHLDWFTKVNKIAVTTIAFWHKVVLITDRIKVQLNKLLIFSFQG